MAKGGIDGYVCKRLKEIWRVNPDLTFDQVATRLYVEMPDNYVSRMVTSSHKVDGFDRVAALFRQSSYVGVQAILQALALDLFRIYAVADPELAAKITA